MKPKLYGKTFMKGRLGKKAPFRRLLAAVFGFMFFQGSAYAVAKPNVMILLDTSGSMGSTVNALPNYAPATAYASCAPTNYTGATVYQRVEGVGYTFYAASIAAVSSDTARAYLSGQGFWFGFIGADHLRLYHGRYLNWQACTGLVARQKLSIAKAVIKSVLGSQPDKRYGVMKFNAAGTGGDVVSPIGTATATIAAAVDLLTPVTPGTPLGPQLRDAGRYFSGTFSPYPTPIQDGCQENAAFIISDGQENVGISVVTQAGIEYTTDHSTWAGTQNLLVNTVSFFLSTGSTAAATLKAAAAAGGGMYISANDPAELQQAFFQIPPGVSMTYPINNTNVTGVVQLAVGVSNAACVQSVLYRVDGNQTGSVVTTPPFSSSWNSATVTNGIHSITATLLGNNGISHTSFPVFVTADNDRTPPVISNAVWTVWQTSASVTWQTDELSDTQIYYGTSAACSQQTTLNPAMVNTHTRLVSGLSSDTDYHAKLRSRDADGNLTEFFDAAFHTNAIVQVGALDHLKLTFGNVALPGPGVKTGGYPYALTAGDCYGLTIEAVDNNNNHFNLTTPVALGHYSLNSSGQEVALVPGISLRDSYQLGISTMVLDMVNGYVFLGSETDINKQICFYRATQPPGYLKSSGDYGDLQLTAVQVSATGIRGISASFIIWPGYANGIALLAPDRALAPATPTGVTGALIGQNQGRPFPVQAYLVDRYFNNARTNTDNLRFSSSLSTQTGFFPFEGVVADGLLASSVTVNSCGTAPTLSVQDLTYPSISNGQVTISMAACGAAPPGAGFYEVAMPGWGRAGDPFLPPGITITVQNVNITPGSGSVRYAGNLIPLIRSGLTSFTYGSGVFGLPAFEFSIPDGYDSSVNGPYVYTLNNQTYNRSEILWLQLVGTGPDELKDATALGGPMQIDPGSPDSITASASPDTIGPLSSSVITAKFMDNYGNGIANLTVAAQVVQGSGNLNVGGEATTSVTLNTDAQGMVRIGFNSQRISETDRVRVWVPGYPGVSAVEVKISITLLGADTVAAYPSPVTITRRPLNIEYRLANNSDVTIIITDYAGHKVWQKKFAAGGAGGMAGPNVMEWDGKNGVGEMVAVGVYGLHLEISANGQITRENTRFGVRK